MKSPPCSLLSLVVTLAALLPGAALLAQNPVPNSPPSLVPHRSSSFDPSTQPTANNPVQPVDNNPSSNGASSMGGGQVPAQPSSPHKR